MTENETNNSNDSDIECSICLSYSTGKGKKQTFISPGCCQYKQYVHVDCLQSYLQFYYQQQYFQNINQCFNKEIIDIQCPICRQMTDYQVRLKQLYKNYYKYWVMLKELYPDIFVIGTTVFIVCMLENYFHSYINTSRLGNIVGSMIVVNTIITQSALCSKYIYCPGIDKIMIFIIPGLTELSSKIMLEVSGITYSLPPMIYYYLFHNYYKISSSLALPYLTIVVNYLMLVNSNFTFNLPYIGWQMKMLPKVITLFANQVITKTYTYDNKYKGRTYDISVLNRYDLSWIDYTDMLLVIPLAFLPNPNKTLYWYSIFQIIKNHKYIRKHYNTVLNCIYDYVNNTSNYFVDRYAEAYNLTTGEKVALPINHKKIFI